MLEQVYSLLDALALSQLKHFHFLRPWWLCAIIPLALFYRYVVRVDDTLSPWKKVMSEKVIQHLSQQHKQAGYFTPRKLFSVYCVLAVLVMAGPSWTRQATPFFVDDSALIIVVDASESMQRSDLKPSRLLRAKQKVHELLDKRGDAKTALIVYAGSGHVAMPITQDQGLIRHFLDVLNTDLLPEPEAKPSAALGPIKSLLDQLKAPSSVVLLTDQTNSQAVSAFKDYWKESEHTLLVWAIGENPSSGLDSSTGLSSQQLDLLEQLADSGKGRMIPFSHNSDDVRSVMRGINNQIMSVNDKSQPWRDAGYLLLVPLFILQLLWFRKGWVLKW